MLLTLDRDCPDLLGVEFYSVQVDHPNPAVVESAEVVPQILQISGASPLRVVGDFFPVFGAPCCSIGNIKLIQNVECLEDTILGLFNRQGSLGKSDRPDKPGGRGEIPRNTKHSAALTKTLDLLPGKVNLLNVLAGHGDVVAEVGHVPIESRRVCQYAERIDMNFEFPADIFKYHAFAAGVGHDGMDTWHEAHVLLDDLANPHILGGGDRFLHVRACAEQEHSKFPWSQSLANVLSLDLLILGEAGEVEKTDLQPLLVETIHSHWQVKSIGSDAAVLGFPAKPRLIARCGPDVLLAPRHDDDVGLQVHGEFERPGEDDRAVFGLDRDPSASPDKRRAGDDMREDPEGDEGFSEMTHSWHSRLIGWVFGVDLDT